MDFGASAHVLSWIMQLKLAGQILRMTCPHEMLGHRRIRLYRRQFGARTDAARASGASFATSIE
jgi:hypothetical protein